VVNGHHYTRAEEVANLAAVAKHHAKLSGAGIFQQSDGEA